MSIQVLDRACRILEALGQGTSLSASALSREVNLPLTTVWRILDALSSHGFVKQEDEGRGYGLGPQLVVLASRVQLSANLSVDAQPTLRMLADKTGEDAGLSILQGDQAIVINRVFGSNPLKIIERAGRPVTLNCGAFRKVLLAYQDDVWINDYVSKTTFKTYTENTITDPILLMKELERTKSSGFGLSFEEFFLEAGGIAAPVFDAGGGIVAAISIAAPMSRLSADRLPQLVNEVVTAGFDLTKYLAGRAPNTWQPLVDVSDPRFKKRIAANLLKGR